MDRRASSMVFRSEIEPHPSKIVQTDRLVSLCRRVQHVDPKGIDCKLISAILNQDSTKSDISFERTKVHGCKSLLRGLRIDKNGQLACFQGLLCVRNDKFYYLLMVLEARLMQ